MTNKIELPAPPQPQTDEMLITYALAAFTMGGEPMLEYARKLAAKGDRISALALKRWQELIT